MSTKVVTTPVSLSSSSLSLSTSVSSRKHGLDLTEVLPLKKVTWGVQRAKPAKVIDDIINDDLNLDQPDGNTNRKQLVWQKLICNEILADGTKKPRVMAAHAKSQTNRIAYPSPNCCDGISDAFNIPCVDTNKSKGNIVVIVVYIILILCSSVLESR